MSPEHRNHFFAHETRRMISESEISGQKTWDFFTHHQKTCKQTYLSQETLWVPDLKIYSIFRGKAHGVVVALDGTWDNSVVAKTERPLHHSKVDCLSEYLTFVCLSCGSNRCPATTRRLVLAVTGYAEARTPTRGRTQRNSGEKGIVAGSTKKTTRVFPNTLWQGPRRKTPSGRTDPGGLTWARTKGLPTPAVRPRRSTKRSTAALLPGCGGRSELPNA